MKLSELIKQLTDIQNAKGDLNVMIDLDTDYSVWSLCHAEFTVVDDEDEYPKSWKMPEGYEYVSLRN